MLQKKIQNNIQRKICKPFIFILLNRSNNFMRWIN